MIWIVRYAKIVQGDIVQTRSSVVNALIVKSIFCRVAAVPQMYKLTENNPTYVQDNKLDDKRN